VSANGRTVGATVDSGGLETVLGVTSGAFSESVTLLGAYATSNFALSTDSHGGTFLTWVASGGFAVGMPGVQRMAGAMAAFTPSGGTSLNTAATSASHAPLLAAGQ
jgi:hypothetical protein